MIPHDLWRRIDPIQGWLSIGEGSALYDLAAQADPRGVIVEIGSWKGRSAACLAFGSQAGPGVPVYCVDPFTGADSPDPYRYAGIAHDGSTLGIFTENMRALGLGCGQHQHVRPIVAYSAEAAPDFQHPISLLFIDGDHTEPGAQADVDLWAPKLMVGGVMAMHDVHPTWQGSYLVGTRLKADPAWRTVAHVEALLILRKVA